MAIKKFDICPICGSKLQKEIQSDTSYVTYVNCDTCGRYAFDEDYYDDYIEDQRTNIGKSEIASYLFYHRDRRPFPFLSEENICVPANYRCVDLAEINSWYPKTFSEKVDTFLLGLSSRANYISEIILFSEEQLISAFFANRDPKGPMRTHPNAIKGQIEFFENYLVKQEYIEVGPSRCVIMPKGLERIESLQRNSAKNTKNVFVAMSFAPEMAEIRNAIKNALLECGYTPRIMDEIEHNHQIVPEMLYEIRESRFVVAELTGHNNGAYFEAGYALGHGKEVIQVCRKDKFGEDGHFDVKQVNTILWDTPEDLTNRLTARIKATITSL